jgi:uncharacterized membrane protein
MVSARFATSSEFDMDFAPLLQASPVIQVHAYFAILALGLGAVQLFRRKGDAPHRLLGRVWVGLMAVVALSSFFIWTIRLWGPFSPIHLISIFTLAMLWLGVSYARRHAIARHMRVMRATYLLALVVTGLLTFLPGRIMYRLAFGPSGADPAKLAGFAAILLVIALASVVVLRWRQSGPGRAFIATH